MRRALIILPFVLIACSPDFAGNSPSGARDYEAYCLGCHGDGIEAGPVATEIGLAPAQLALLAQGNGGTYPKARVMSKIYGYEQHGKLAGAKAGEMPAFAALIEGETVLYDSGDGIATPTPKRLVQLAEYVEAMQR